MKKILYIDGCICRECSRTERLAQAWLQKAMASGDTETTTIILENEKLSPLNGDILHWREAKIASGDFSDGYFRYAKMMADADELLIAVPFWDLSFPSALKVFLEMVCIRGLTFQYSEQGIPVGMTKIRRVTYITTAGGYLENCNFGFEYVKGLMRGLFSVDDIRFVCAQGLDIVGNDPETILQDVIVSLNC